MPARLPWPKMPKQPAKNGARLAVALHVLGGEEADERLGDGESHAGTSASWSRVGMSSAHASLEAT